MPKTQIKYEGDSKMIRYFGYTKFTGCQCFKDCTCKQDFVSEWFNYYTVIRRLGTKKQKTTRHSTREEAETRWEFIKNL